MDFSALEQLRNKLRDIRASHLAAMNFYASDDGQGFFHQPHKRQSASLSSTATCVSSVVRGGLWGTAGARWGSPKQLLDRLLRVPRTGAGLDPDNPFSLAFIVEASLDLLEAEAGRVSRLTGSVGAAEKAALSALTESTLAVVEGELVPELIKLLSSSDEVAENPFRVRGAINITPYPPSAYLTQLVFRTLLRRPEWRKQLQDSRLLQAVGRWARGEIERQIVLLTTHSRIADPLQLAYAIVLHSSVREGADVSPEEQALVRSALGLFFSSQLPSGLWPPSQPLFHYPDVGNALAFEYELLTQLLLTRSLWSDLLEYLPHLDLALDQLSPGVFRLVSNGTVALAWASGHHPQFSGPESWSTACVYDFSYALDRLAAEATRRAAFVEVGASYSAPKVLEAQIDPNAFAPPDKFLDASISVDGQPRSLRTIISERLVIPIIAERPQIARGGSFLRTTPMSAILFGPPGTSKTQLAKLIADVLGWPLLGVDPSYLVQDGIDKLYSRANLLFRMIQRLEETVVFLDEFDEMGRNRAASSDMLSRFITTSMLPKLAAINDERRVVFLLATNFVGDFDAAFSRGGRFDLMLQVMPPTYDEKIRKWPDLEQSVEKLKERARPAAREIITALTFLETAELVRRIRANGGSDIDADLGAVSNGSTMRRKEGDKDWAQRCKEDEKYLRL